MLLVSGSVTAGEQPESGPQRRFLFGKLLDLDPKHILPNGGETW